MGKTAATAGKRRRPSGFRIDRMKNCFSTVCSASRRVGNRGGFTLLELLVVTSIIALLTSLGVMGAGKAMEAGRKTREINAARTLTEALLTAASDNNGELPLGFDDRQAELVMPDGRVLHGEAGHRYPFRFAPYFDYRMEGTILVNRNKGQMAQVIPGNNDYAVSLCPALGLNSLFVGGEYMDGEFVLPAEAATRMIQVGRASSLLVFASASYGEGAKKVDGFYKVTSPRVRTQIWSTADYDQNSSSEAYGHVDPRYKGQAVCSFMDGSVRLYRIEELRDMRLWSRMAAEADDRNYSVAVAALPPGRGGR
jgi:prepilin-type N-terminal cleavage/methylation domain-containing protein